MNIGSNRTFQKTKWQTRDFAQNPGHFDPRQYLGPAREEMKKLYIHKIVKVLGSNDKL